MTTTYKGGKKKNSHKFEFDLRKTNKYKKNLIIFLLKKWVM